jgi:hypothetical protein
VGLAGGDETQISVSVFWKESMESGIFKPNTTVYKEKFRKDPAFLRVTDSPKYWI